ncbi:MAG: TIGR03016 family PEP-CTERM system-associated outer membrane protein, partial [Betaproteobacteria bacterium]
ELTTAPLRRSDVIADFDAGILVRSRGARLTITGDAGLDFIAYARRTEPDRVLPRGHLNLNAILLEQALYFDGALSAVRTRSDPLAAQSDTASTANTVSTVSLRASPYFQHDFSSTLSASARSDTTVTRNRTDGSTSLATPNGSTYQHATASIVRKAAPIGLSVDASHEETSYQDRDASVLRTDSLQATLSAALASDVLLGLVGGHEHAVYSSVAHDDTVYGGMLQWHPSRRTEFDADAAHHYFGLGWNLHFRDRLPRSTIDLTLTRKASASTATFGVNGPDSDPATLLGALLSSRMPDAGARDQAVDDLVQTRNLPGNFAQPLQITSESAQLATRATLNLIFNGVRDTVYASAYYQKAQALPGATATPLATTFDSRQWGSSLGLYHRLMPDVSAAVEIEWSGIDALGARAGDSSRQAAGTLSLTRRLGPRTSLSCGLRHFNSRVVLNSTSTTTQVRENQAFAGLRVQY